MPLDRGSKIGKWVSDVPAHQRGGVQVEAGKQRVDGSNAMVSLHGFDPKDSEQVTVWSDRI